MTTEQALQLGLEHQHAGRLGEAELTYREILRVEPGNAAARHMLGVIAYQVGKHAVALELIDRALEVHPRYAEALSNRGLVLHDLGRDEEAIASCERALALRPDYVEALINLGISLNGLERYEQAIASYARAIALRPDHAIAHSNRAASLNQLKRYEEGLESVERALALDPDHAGALSNCGLILSALKRYDEALARFARAIEIDPSHADALSNRSLTLGRLKRYEEGLADCERALLVRPRFPEALSNRGIMLRNLKRSEEALASFDAALALRPGYAEAHSNRGLALNDLRRFEEALETMDRALALKPDYAEAYSNRGLILYNLGRHREALDCYARAFAIEPGSPEAHLNESICRLLMAELEDGFAHYEWRWKCDAHAAGRRVYAGRSWLGEEPLAGKSIVLHWEQGLGDILMFLRYVPLVAAKGAAVHLEVPKVLLPLVRGLAGPRHVHAEGEPLPDTDFHASLLSLPHAFRTTLESIPAQVPYLSVDPGACAAWRAKLAPQARLMVGLSWRGNPMYERDHDRSIAFESVLPLLSVPGAVFVSLQKELHDNERALTSGLANFVHPGEDFARTAEIAGAADVVVTVDSAWSHWTGAIGHPAWVLLAATPHWCWMLDRDDSPWYPSARLYRREADGAWGGVVERIRADLSAFEGAKPPAPRRAARKAASPEKAASGRNTTRGRP